MILPSAAAHPKVTRSLESAKLSDNLTNPEAGSAEGLSIVTVPLNCAPNMAINLSERCICQFKRKADILLEFFKLYQIQLHRNDWPFLVIGNCDLANC
jgi:hypothetical protein